MCIRSSLNREMIMKLSGSKLMLVVAGLLAFVMVSQVAYAQQRGVVYTVTKDGAQYKINKTGDPPSASASYTFNFRPGHADCVMFANATGDTVYIRNTTWPTGKIKKADTMVPPGQTGGAVWFYCRDVGTWVFEVGDGVGGDPDAVLTVNVTCDTRLPALTDWGVIVLALLALMAGTIAMRRHRRSRIAA
jgi:hypothetical protein